MEDTRNTNEDALTKARRERRRLLIGGGVTGSLMLTLPSRRVLANTSKKKAHGSLWCSFCNTKKGKGSLSHSPITNQCGDSSSTWVKYTTSYTTNDVPDNWQGLLSSNFESKFPRPTGYDLYINGSKKNSSVTPTFLQCINGQVSYQKSGSTTITSSYAQQAACSYFNQQYYTCNGVSFYYGMSVGKVQSDFKYKTGSGCNSMASTYKTNYNLD